MIKVTFPAIGSSTTWRVPKGIRSIDFEIAGGRGGGSLGGLAALITGTLAVIPNEVLTITAASAGSLNGLASFGDGFGGAGAAPGNLGSSGGGASSIKRGIIRIARAGGGGGDSQQSLIAGGSTSGFNGNPGNDDGTATGGGGATPLTPGAGGVNGGQAGTALNGGDAAGSSLARVGGGGGGEFGGGGGGKVNVGGLDLAASGGAGSSAVDLSVTNVTIANSPTIDGYICLFHEPALPTFRNIVQRTNCKCTRVYHRVPNATPASGSLFPLGTTKVTVPVPYNGFIVTESFLVTLLPNCKSNRGNH